jgi:hypothetical protein
MNRIKRKIVMTLAALSLGAFMIPLQGCFYGPGGGWGGGYGGGGYPAYSAAPLFGPAYVAGRPYGNDHYGWGARGYAYGHPAFGHDFGHADFGHVDGHAAVAHEAHGEAHHRG